MLALQALRRPDAVVLIAPTLIVRRHACTGSLARASAWLRIQDYEVDAAFELGLLKGSRAARIARWVESQLLQRFDAVSSITRQMSARVGEGAAPSKVVCLPGRVGGVGHFSTSRAQKSKLP